MNLMLLSFGDTELQEMQREQEEASTRIKG